MYRGYEKKEIVEYSPKTTSRCALQNNFTKCPKRSHIHCRLFYFNISNGMPGIVLFRTSDSLCISLLEQVVG